ncbi:MAG: hypothetical protein AAFR55_07045 [Pseudomonadota bacterium]
MPQLFVLGAAGVAAYAAYKLAGRVRRALKTKDTADVDAATRDAASAHIKLERDPETGVYRPEA